MRVGPNGAEYRNGKTGKTGELIGNETVEIGTNLSFGDGGVTTKIVEMVAVSGDKESNSYLRGASEREPINNRATSYQNNHRTTTIVDDFEKMIRE
jgi:hypothetical protein